MALPTTNNAVMLNTTGSEKPLKSSETLSMPLNPSASNMSKARISNLKMPQTMANSVLPRIPRVIQLSGVTLACLVC